jgi:hypothetical protein
MPIAIQSQKSAVLAIVDTDVQRALAMLDQAKIDVLVCGRLESGADYLVLADDADMEIAIAALDRLGIALSDISGG